jgi:decaprenyl-phosphate phosphoribosyltransferase
MAQEVGVVGDATARPADAGAAVDPRGKRAASRPASLAGGLIRQARPKQWAKNVLVGAAPGAAGVLTTPHQFGVTVLAFVSFCLTASGVYYLNDARDVNADRIHPTKRNRPMAAGVVPLPLGIGVGVALLVGGCTVAALLRPEFLLTMIAYITITTSYTMWFKHVAVIDMAMVAAGFVVRAVAGGTATGVPLSEWFLIVASFGSLFMVAGKRHAEHVTVGTGRGDVRATLAVYSDTYLRYVWMIASGVTITAYCLWAFERSNTHSASIWYQFSIVPFTLALLRYALLLDGGEGGAPEDLVLHDRTMQVLGLAWAAVFAGGVYLGR